MRGKEVKIMPYQKCKIYNDGSHFIAIPHTTRPAAPKRYHPEEVIEVVDDTPQQPQLNTDKCNTETALTALNDINEVDSGECSEATVSPPADEISKPTTTRKITRRQLFDELYEECKSLKKREREKYIYDRMKQYFANAEAAKQYVDGQFDRLKRNAIAKRVRLVRKVNLQTFNYFCTFTYDGKKHTEESFRKKLSDITAANGNTSACGNAHRIKNDCIFTGCFIFRPTQWSANLWK